MHIEVESMQDVQCNNNNNTLFAQNFQYVQFFLYKLLF